MSRASDLEIEAKYDATKSFATFLGIVDDGALHAEVTEKLGELLASLEAHADETRRDAKGRITLSLEFVVDEKGSAAVTGDVVLKKPRPRRGATHLFVLKGKASTKNPKQVELPLRDVNQKERVAEPAQKGGTVK